MTVGNNALLENYRTRVTELEALRGALGLLGWDQQTMMPKQGASPRGQQQAALASILHERLTDPAFGDLISALSDEPPNDPELRSGLKATKKQRDQAVKLPASLVREKALAQAAGDAAWNQAKADGAVDAFKPALARLIELAREESAHLGESGAHPYEPLLDRYEPGMKVETLKETFSNLEQALRPLIEAVGELPTRNDYDAHFDKSGQLALHHEVANALGFDMNSGRLDESVHPFTCGLCPQDVRITTRIDETSILAGLGGTIHEVGHGLYEQGLPLSLSGTGAMTAASTGLHESQSRFWENFIGSSKPFFNWLAKVLPQHFNGQTADATALYQARNRITPSYIRVEADEATYNLHILVRFELEVALLEGSLTVDDLEAAWNDTYTRVLGVTPRTPNEGVLQDVHWSHGFFGYFPTYTLGNLWAASLAAGLEAQTPNLWENVENGSFGGILDWLREHVHHKGHTLEAAQIVEQAVGKRDAVADLAAHLWHRHGALYGLTR